MARDDDSFWLDIFRRSPLIATCMAICGIIGFGVGFWLFVDFGRPMPIRWVLCMLFSSFCGGCFVGLVIGVIVDTVVASVRDKDGKKRKFKRKDRDRDWE